jgi:hypothetical protein
LIQASAIVGVFTSVYCCNPYSPSSRPITSHIDDDALKQLWSQRLGRTVLLTNRLDWSAEQVVAGYSGQQQIERVFRGLKDDQWLAWGPMYHRTDSKIRVLSFTACSAFPCFNMSIDNRRVRGPVSPSNNCWSNSARSNDSSCSIGRSATKAPPA